LGNTPVNLGRFYTKPEIGRVLIQHMRVAQPGTLLDLGSGGGALSLAAMERWKKLSLVTVDVDAPAQQSVENLFPRNGKSIHCHIRTDVLEINLPNLIFSRIGELDAVVCNPPFTTPKWRKGFAEILEETGFSNCMPVLAEIDAALGIILPDNLISGDKYQGFRRDLLYKYNVEGIIKLPRGSFYNTEALAHIVIVKKIGVSSDFIPIRKMSMSGLIGDVAFVSRDQGVERLDFDFHRHGKELIAGKVTGTFGC
jgi:type I restriction enzyme M protein